MAEVHVEARGSGQPLVLVHGWGAAGAVTWAPQLDALAEDFRVLALDLPGFGLSPAPARADAATLSRAVATVVAETGRDDAVLVGWSMGGLVVLEHASRGDATQVAGIVVVDVAARARPAPGWALGSELGDGFARRVDEWAARWRTEREQVVREVTTLAFANPEEHRETIEQLVADALRANPEAALEAFVNLLDCDFRHVLSGIRIPALLVFGGCSTSTTPTVAASMTRALPAAQLVVLEKAGHALMLEEPERFNAALRRFARSVSRRRTA